RHARLPRPPAQTHRARGRHRDDVLDGIRPRFALRRRLEPRPRRAGRDQDPLHAALFRVRHPVPGHALPGPLGADPRDQSRPASGGTVPRRGCRGISADAVYEHPVSFGARTGHDPDRLDVVQAAVPDEGDGVIRLENVTKSYLTLRGRKVVFRNFSLDIPEGHNVGLIGRNGAGKSTLMRLISAVDFPDSGKITTSARLSWPVGLTGGLQKSLTGRDNVKFVCRIHGVRKSGIADKIRFVQDFAELGDYFDQPVSSYSSGMRARLAFGLSMAFDFD